MGLVADVNRLVTATWAPAGPGGGLIAGGSFAGSIDSSFESGATLEVFGFDATRSKIVPVGGARCSEKFDSITWSRHARPHPQGLIAGGLHDGTVRVWDAAQLLRDPQISFQVDHAVVFGGSNVAKKHTGPISGLEFNPFRANLLASAGADGQVLIWDLSSAANGPTARTPTGAVASGSGLAGNKESLTTLAWNCHVEHILGTGSGFGVVAIWDLKMKRPVLSIRNPRGRLRSSSINWNPDAATQILTCTDDGNEEKGGLLWDLRNITQPIMEFTHHGSSGIATASWCPHDSELILTSSKDSRTAVVSARTGTRLAELPGSNQWNFDVRWSPKLPGVYLTASFDGRLSVKALLTSDVTPSVSMETANVLAESFGAQLGDMKPDVVVQSPRAGMRESQKISVTQAPKWLRRRCSISFGFGGRAAVAKATDSGKVQVHRAVRTVSGIFQSTEDLDNMLNEATVENLAPIRDYCTEAANSSKTPEDEIAWEVLAIQLGTDARVKLLSYLGYEVPASEGRHSVGIELSPPLAEPVRAEIPSASDTNVTGGVDSSVASTQRELNALQLDGPAPWDVGGSVLDTTSGKGQISASGEQNGLRDLLPAETASGAIGNGVDLKGLDLAGVEKLIKKAVIVGDFSAAIKTCLQADRTADALILAHAAGPDTWYLTQQEYLASLDSGGSRGILKAITGSSDGLESFIESTVSSESKSAWKDALAVLVTYEKGSELVQKCNSLGNRLMEKRQHAAALACFTCALNTKMMTTTWMRKAPSGKSASTVFSQRTEMLSQLVRKVRACAVVTSLARGEDHMGGYRVHDEVSAQAMLEYAGILAAQGEIELAKKYVQHLDGAVSSIYGSAEDLRSRVTECIQGAPCSLDLGYQGASYGQVGSGHIYRTTFSQPQPSQPFSTFQSWSQPPLPTPKTNSTLYRSAVPSRAALPYSPPPAPVAPSYGASAPASPGLQAPMPSMSQTSPGSQYSVSYATSAVANNPPPMPEPVPAAIPPPPAPTIPTTSGAGGSGSMYGLPGQPMQSHTSTPPMQYTPPTMAMPAPPPPPPPSSGDMPVPHSLRGKTGASVRLPPSAEVAVAESRARKPQSSSKMPGQGHRRSESVSSSGSLGSDPNVTIDKVDISKVAANQQVIVRSLRGAFLYTVKLNNSPLYKRKMDDISKKLGKLLQLINAGAIDAPVVELLVEIGKVLERGDYDAASKVVARLTKDYWDENGLWIQSLKRLFDSARTGR